MLVSLVPPASALLSPLLRFEYTLSKANWYTHRTQILNKVTAVVQVNFEGQYSVAL